MFIMRYYYKNKVFIILERITKDFYNVCIIKMIRQLGARSIKGLHVEGKTIYTV